MLRKITKDFSEKPVSRPRFELSTSQIRVCIVIATPAYLTSELLNNWPSKVTDYTKQIPSLKFRSHKPGQKSNGLWNQKIYWRFTVCLPFDPTHYQAKPSKIPHLIFTISILMLSYYTHPVFSVRISEWKCLLSLMSVNFRKVLSVWNCKTSSGSLLLFFPWQWVWRARQHSRRTWRQRTSVITCDVRSTSKQQAKFYSQTNWPVLNI